VTQASNGTPMGGVRVEIVSGPKPFVAQVAARARVADAHGTGLAPRIDLTRAAEDGHYHFLDLPDGTYTLRASLPAAGTRYGIAESNGIVVRRDKDGAIAMAVADLALSPTTVSGRVTRDGASVFLAEVRLAGSDEFAFTDEQGRFSLAGIGIGQRTLQVRGPGCRPVDQPVSLEREGASVIADIELVAI